MLVYLDNWQSSAPPGAALASEPQRGRGIGLRPRRFGGTRPRRPGEPLGAQPPRSRGINENYARELMELHTLGADGGYTQEDVQEVARAFTGWTLRTPREGGGYRFAPGMHDDGEKVVLGH